ncbi:MAG: class I SAM-dependent methyltransferase [Ignavibacteria bacterium]
MLKKLLKNTFDRFGYDIRKKSNGLKQVNTRKAEGFPLWLKEAQELGIDVNDHINNKFSDPAKVLEILVFPLIRDLSEPVICEIGVGTGRWSRAFAKELSFKKQWKLFIVDHSPWIADFLKNYFKDYQNVFPVLNDGRSLPMIENNYVDLVFSNGTFVELSLTKIYSYSKELNRILKTGGILIFNYLDLNSNEGWDHLKDRIDYPGNPYTYHTTETIDRIFKENGFEIVERKLLGNSTYVTLKKLHSISNR